MIGRLARCYLTVVVTADVSILLLAATAYLLLMYGGDHPSLLEF